MTPAVANTAHLQRIYYDASHWNRLLRHAHREEMIRSFNRRKRAVFPSVINAAELLNTPAPDLRRELCGLMARLHDESHTILDHPSHVLSAAAEGWRRGDSSLVLSESAPARAMRKFVEAPGKFDEEAQRDLASWTNAMKQDGAEFRRELGEVLGEEGFAGDARLLLEREDFAGLLYEKVREVREAVESPDELRELLPGAAVWAAYAGSIAYEFHLTTEARTRTERRRLPGGPDMRQVTYLGLVNRFIARDTGLLAAARWVAELLPNSMTVEVLASDDYLARIGFPFVEAR